MRYPPAILAIGRNYARHADEMNMQRPERPVLFMKNPASIIGNGQPIRIPRVCREPVEQVDYEGELAVIVDRDCRDVDAEEALSFVRGYAIANDVTARWWQREGAGGQWVRGKSFDTFCPLSEMAPATAVEDPQALELVTRVNGAVVQQAATNVMLFPVATLIAELSRGMTLLEGTVMLTGTPAGVGAAADPPRFLRDGDVIEITISGLGMLRNPVVAE